jgi:hypothetical protein
MTKDRRIMSKPPPNLLSSPVTLDIETICFEERRVIFPAIHEALDLSGCWLLERRPTSFTHVEFKFEVQPRFIVELYAGLIAAGLELTRASHDELSMLCTLRKHEDVPGSLPGVITAGLRVCFLEDCNLPKGVTVGPARA